MTATPPDGAEEPEKVPSAGAVVRASAMGQCPRCHEPTMFAGFIRFADRCDSCGLNYDGFNVGDGPAAFLTLAIGTVLGTLAIVFDQALDPPFWVHILLWVPIATALVVGGLRVAKGALLHVEYFRRAAQANNREEP